MRHSVDDYAASKYRLFVANSITNSAYQFGYDMDAIVGGAHNGGRRCNETLLPDVSVDQDIWSPRWRSKNHEAAVIIRSASQRKTAIQNNDSVSRLSAIFSAKCSDAYWKYNTGQPRVRWYKKADNPIKQSKGVQISQIIRGKLVIFFNYPLLICCLPWVW